MVELLAPAGSLESLQAAVNAGADAVYIGGNRFGARAYADNPEEDALLRGIDYCHIHGRTLYMTVNTLLKERELEEQLYEYMLPYYREGLDGVIVQDFGVVRFLREHFPKLLIHTSTQMTVTDTAGARLLQSEGASRVVTARELSLEEIRRIIRETGMEVETFIHGAMCYSYSGQCLMSSMIGGRSGNRGRCAQPCRLPYRVGENGSFGRPSCVLSMKDMCTLDILPELVEAGIASLKIEGRMKRPEYAAGVTGIYRKYLDRCRELGIREGILTQEQRRKYRVSEEDQRILMDLYNRGGFTEGYYHQHNGPKMMSMERPNHFGTAALRVEAGKKGVLYARALEPLYRGDVLEVHETKAETTLTADMPEGSSVVCPKQMMKEKRLTAGTVLYRTKSERLLQSLREQYTDRNCKEKIKGVLRISGGAPAILELICRGRKISVCTETETAFAQSQPTGKEAVDRQMRKTGNTPFEFESLQIELEDGLFLPVRELNELRRRGMEQLEKSILDSYRRTDEIKQPDSEMCKAALAESEKRIRHLTVSVLTKEQLDVVLKTDPVQVGEIIMDLLPAVRGKCRIDVDIVSEWVSRIQGSGRRCILNFPPVFREKDRRILEQLEKAGLLQRIDGFLLHTVDELGYIRTRAGAQAQLIADDTFYAYNAQAAGFLKDHGISRMTLPAELNFRELMQLLKAGRLSFADTEGRCADTELVVYGRQALMHSAQCVRKNTSGCTGKPEFLMLKDRKQTEFPVLNRCGGCCNTIYNSVPLELLDCTEEICQLGVQTVRLSFTTESGAETAQILRDYIETFAGVKSALGVNTTENSAASDTEYAERRMSRNSTRGHFRRGVE